MSNTPKGNASKPVIIPRIVFLLLVLAASVFAERLPVKIYTSADGLGSGFVDYVMRDSRGFMWFCTRDGLSRFDGSRFVNYQIGEKNAPPGIENIYETRDGMYWISTTGGTFRFNPDNIGPNDPVTPRLNAEPIIESRGGFFEDKKGDIWMTTGTPERLVKQADGKFIKESVDLGLPLSADQQFIVSDVNETPDGSLWLYSTLGLVRRLQDGRTVFYSDEIVPPGSASMMIDNLGRVWLARGDRILVLNPESGETLDSGGGLIGRSLKPGMSVSLRSDQPVRLPEKRGEIYELTTNGISEFGENSYAKRLFQTSDGDIWITAENYLMQISGTSFHLHTEAEGLPSVMARMAEDAAGNLWIGGHTVLARLDRQGLITLGTADGANSSRFFAITEGSDGTPFFVSRDFYLHSLNGERLESVRPEIPRNALFLWSSRFAHLASNGDWWIATNEKLYRFSGASDFSQLNKRKPSKVYSKEDGLTSNAIFQLFEDKSGTMWISTRGDGRGVVRLNKSTDRFEPLTASMGFPANKAFTSAVQDPSGNIWFCFYEGGVGRFDGQKFELLGEGEGLSEGVLSDLHVDKSGRLWLGSTLAGAFRVDDPGAANPVFTNISTSNGLTSNNIRTITEDNLGRIYLGTARGIDRLTPETGLVKHYSVSDGLAADFVVDSHRDKDGNLWFATNGGISKLTPRPEEKTSAPRIFVGGVRIAGVEQPIAQLGSMGIDAGELYHIQNNFQIDFFGLGFRAGESLNYQYKLEGADEEWSMPTESRSVTYGNLQPATYRFLVRAVNSEGVASTEPASVSFRILPPIWLRWWFIALCVLALTLLVIAFYRYRLARLREVNKALEDARLAEEDLRRSREERLAELEKVRGRIATDLHDDIGASLTQIAILSEVAQAQHTGNGSTDTLARISDISNELVGTMSDIVWSINPMKDHLSDLTQRIRRFAADVRSARGIGFQFNAPPPDVEIVVNTNLRREIFLVFKESVNNILKHSEATQVRIDLEIDGGEVILRIADNGKGFDLRPEFADSLSAIQIGGNGIASMQKRALEMGGKFEIHTVPGGGTTVQVKLPLA